MEKRNQKDALKMKIFEPVNEKLDRNLYVLIVITRRGITLYTYNL